jgi:TonB family protein
MKTYTQSQIKERKSQRRRLIASTFITVVIHFLVFMFFMFIIPEQVFDPPEEYIGPVYIELEDFPEVVPEIEETVKPSLQEKEEPQTAAEEPVSTAGTEKSSPPEKTNTEAPGTDKEEVVSPVKNPEETIPEQRPQAEPVKENEPEKDFSENTVKEPEPEQSALDLSDLDKMLETEPDISSGPVENKEPGNSDFSLDWEDAAQGREVVSHPNPDLPDWVSKEGIKLKVIVAFTLTPQGFLQNIKLEISCGFPDVDDAVMKAIRNWRFKAVNSTLNVKGSVTYYIEPR